MTVRKDIPKNILSTSEMDNRLVDPTLNCNDVRSSLRASKQYADYLTIYV